VEFGRKPKLTSQHAWKPIDSPVFGEQVEREVARQAIKSDARVCHADVRPRFP
jgi:hypothetical protein